jgi:hypothetical protein
MHEAVPPDNAAVHRDVPPDAKLTVPEGEPEPAVTDTLAE